MGLTLRDGDREYFYAALDKYFPNLKDRYIRTYGNSYEVTSPRINELMGILREGCRSGGIMLGVDNVFGYLNEFPQIDIQGELF